MNVWLAGVPGGGSMGSCKRERELNLLWDKRLWSYYHLIETNGKMTEDKKINLFLDSGAFSAWTQGVSINIREYISFIKEHEEVIEIYANLDVIGIGGKQPNQLTAEMTLKNQHIMEKAGLHPIPVFHYGEPISFLENYVKNYDYLALGVAGNSGVKLIPWLDVLFSKHICDEKGMPKLKIHGFAVTSLPLMLRYPWYSVDSTSWVITGRLGSIYIPRFRSGEWIYDEQSWKIAVSNRSGHKRSWSTYLHPFKKRAGNPLKLYSQQRLCFG